MIALFPNANGQIARSVRAWVAGKQRIFKPSPRPPWGDGGPPSGKYGVGMWASVCIGSSIETDKPHRLPNA